MKNGTVLVSLHFCHNISNDDNDDVDYENEDDLPTNNQEEERQRQDREGGCLEKRRQTVS